MERNTALMIILNTTLAVSCIVTCSIHNLPLDEQCLVTVSATDCLNASSFGLFQRSEKLNFSHCCLFGVCFWFVCFVCVFSVGIVTANRTLYWSYLSSLLKSTIVKMDDVFALINRICQYATGLQA